MRIDHLILLIHPAGWQDLARNQPEMIRKNNYQIFVDRERECTDRWLTELPAKDSSSLVIQLGGNAFCEQDIRPRTGNRNVCLTSESNLLPDRPKPDADDEPSCSAYQHQFHINIVRRIREHLEEHDLVVDPDSVTSEIWGGSFEGCAPGYAGAFAHGLGLAKPPKMRFEMNVWDAKFLHETRRWETIPLEGTDIEAWLFTLHDGTFAAIYQARRSEQWLDKRPVTLSLNPARMYVSTKTGYTIWPAGHWEKGIAESWKPYSLTTAWVYGHWIRAWRLDYEEFRRVIASATVGPPPRGYEDYVAGGDFWQADAEGESA
jgi:hypothetical protein